MTDPYTISESEEILREIRITADETRLAELREELEQARAFEDEDYTRMLMRVMK